MRNKVLRVLFAFIPFFIVGLFIFSRDPIYYLKPEFWAEDCIDFFTAANEKGLRSLFIPIWGYHFFLGRVIAYTATFFPVLFTPSIYIFSCLILNSFIISYFARSGFSWLIASRNIRIIICILMATGPGQEVFTGLCVMYSPLALLGFLFLLERPWSLSWKKIILFLFLMFSTGVMFATIPLVFYLYYQTRRKSYLILLLMIVGTSIYNVVGTTNPESLAVQTGEFKFANLFWIPTVLIKNFIARLFVFPFLGQSGLAIIQNPTTIFLLAVPLGVYFYYFVKYNLYKDQKIHILLLVYSSVIGIFGVIALVRSSGLDILLLKANVNWGTRYFFLSGVGAVLLWSYMALAQSNRRNYLNFALIIYIFFCVNAINWSPLSQRQYLQWYTHAYTIQKAINNREKGLLEQAQNINFPIHPIGLSCSININPK